MLNPDVLTTATRRAYSSHLTPNKICFFFHQKLKNTNTACRIWVDLEFGALLFGGGGCAAIFAYVRDTHTRRYRAAKPHSDEDGGGAAARGTRA